MDIIIRLIFALLILGINLMITDLFPNTPFFSRYETDLRVFIPFLALLFLQPFIDIFNPFLCSINQIGKEKNDDETIDFEHELFYKGKEPLKVRIIGINTKNYNVSCKIWKTGENYDTPEQLIHYLCKENPILKITFHVVPKDNVREKDFIVIYKLNNIIKKIKIK